MSKTKWEGYTLEELRCQRALTESRIMQVENRINRDFGSLKMPFAGGRANVGHSILDRVLGALSYLDWVIIVVSLYRKFARLFSRKSHRS